MNARGCEIRVLSISVAGGCALKFCVFGAGAVGGFVGGMVARSGADVSLVTRGAHLEALQANGLKIKTSDDTFTVRVPASNRPEEFGVQDVVFLAVKTHALEKAAAELGPLIGPETTIVSAQNGIPFWYFHAHGGPYDGHTLQTADPDGKIATAIGCERVLGCVITSSNEVVEPGVVRNIGNRVFALGEPDRSLSERASRISELLEAGGLSAPVKAEIRGELWIKLWGNVSFSPMAVLTSARLGPLVEQPDLLEIGIVIMEEVQAVGEALGVKFTGSIDDRVEGTRRVGSHKTSILQDLEQGRPMEVDGITGTVVELARLLDVDTPTTDMIYALLRRRAREAGLYRETGYDPLIPGTQPV